MKHYQFTKEEQLAILKSALYQLKDAPLLQSQQDRIIVEALTLVEWGNYDLDYSRLSDWGKSVVEHYLTVVR